MGWRPTIDYHPLHDLQMNHDTRLRKRYSTKTGCTRWDQFSLDAQKWVMNELKARDIHGYNPKTGPRGAHFGRYVNQYLARKFIESGDNMHKQLFVVGKKLYILSCYVVRR